MHGTVGDVYTPQVQSQWCCLKGIIRAKNEPFFLSPSAKVPGAWCTLLIMYTDGYVVQLSTETKTKQRLFCVRLVLG